MQDKHFLNFFTTLNHFLPNANPFMKKVLLDPNLIYTLSEWICFEPNYGAPLLAFQFNYGISCDCYVHYRSRTSDSICQLKIGIPVFRFYPQIFYLNLENAVFRCGRSDVVEKYRYT